MRWLFWTPTAFKTIGLPRIFASPRFPVVESQLRSPNSRAVGHKIGLISYSSTSHQDLPLQLLEEESSKRGPLKPGLYLVGMPIGNLEDITLRLPTPSECDLYYVNRDTLFSYHKDSEIFLQRMMSLYVSSHYKNSPNDLQLMADAPAHHLFVLLGPVDESKNQLPDILYVIQVCLEGQISRKSAIRSLIDGHQPHGDQIPWKFCEQFQDTVFPTLSGVRIVRIATHPNATRILRRTIDFNFRN